MLVYSLLLLCRIVMKSVFLVPVISFAAIAATFSELFSLTVQEALTFGWL